MKYNSFRRGKLHICSRVLFGRSKSETIVDLGADVRLAVGCESASAGRGLGWRCTLRGHEQQEVMVSPWAWVQRREEWGGDPRAKLWVLQVGLTKRNQQRSPRSHDEVKGEKREGGVLETRGMKYFKKDKKRKL